MKILEILHKAFVDFAQIKYILSDVKLRPVMAQLPATLYIIKLLFALNKKT